MKRLYRSKDNRVLCGVCGGIGDYLNVDPTIIRAVMPVAWLYGKRPDRLYCGGRDHTGRIIRRSEYLLFIF